MTDSKLQVLDNYTQSPNSSNVFTKPEFLSLIRVPVHSNYINGEVSVHQKKVGTPLSPNQHSGSARSISLCQSLRTLSVLGNIFESVKQRGTMQLEFHLQSNLA
jgi:hypothetical protein